MVFDNDFIYVSIPKLVLTERMDLIATKHVGNVRTKMIVVM